KTRVQEASSGLINHHSISSPSGDRLKPPPSCVNFDKKRIKLKPDVAVTGVAAKKSEDAPITIISPKTKEESPKNLKRAEQEAPNQESTTPKKKFVPISWP
ncbi:hypothetical protein ElyMa_005886900, partial [Elysia marginata]